MQPTAAKDDILDHTLSISPVQFEQLCRILIKRSEPTRELELTPASGDAGIDVHAVIDRDLFQARLGVQSKRNDEGNTVSSDTIRTFKGSLREGEYHVGTFITTSSFSNPAVESAEKGYIQLIDGDRLTEVMLESELGVVRDGDGYATDWEFWDIFELEDNDLVRSDAVPQADTVEVLNIVLRGIERGFDVKPTITEFLERETGNDWDPRQADYYPHAAWPLGFVHKDTTVRYNGYERRQWTLSRIGAEYVQYLTEGKTEAAERLLNKRIREMEIAKRVLDVLEEEGTLSHHDLQQIVHENTLPKQHEHGLSETTAYRRGDTIGDWIEKLPEVVRRGPTRKNSTYEYLHANLSDF
jgi:restriction system protein